MQPRFLAHTHVYTAHSLVSIPDKANSKNFELNIGKVTCNTYHKLEDQNPQLGMGYVKSNLNDSMKLEGQIEEQKWQIFTK